MAQTQYKCELCGATLASQAELEEHHRKLHPPYGCKICGETFSTKEELETHQYVEHPEQTPTQ